MGTNPKVENRIAIPVGVLIFIPDLISPLIWIDSCKKKKMKRKTHTCSSLEICSKKAFQEPRKEINDMMMCDVKGAIESNGSLERQVCTVTVTESISLLLNLKSTDPTDIQSDEELEENYPQTYI